VAVRSDSGSGWSLPLVDRRRDEMNLFHLRTAGIR
jgi:hypothetical protein